MPLVYEALSKHNWLFFREQDNFEAAFQSLITAINTDLEHVREIFAGLRGASDSAV